MAFSKFIGQTYDCHNDGTISLGSVGQVLHSCSLTEYSVFCPTVHSVEPWTQEGTKEVPEHCPLVMSA